MFVGPTLSPLFSSAKIVPFGSDRSLNMHEVCMSMNGKQDFR